MQIGLHKRLLRHLYEIIRSDIFRYDIQSLRLLHTGIYDMIDAGRLDCEL